MGVPDHVMLWISGYVTCRSQRVVVNGATLQSMPLLSGVCKPGWIIPEQCGTRYWGDLAITEIRSKFQNNDTNIIPLKSGLFELQ